MAGKDRSEPRSRPPAASPQGRERQLTSLAYDLVEKKLRDGTASAQETTFFLRMGSSRELLEKERMAHEIELMKAKQEAMAAHARIEELYEGAIDAMRYYGTGVPPERRGD